MNLIPLPEAVEVFPGLTTLRSPVQDVHNPAFGPEGYRLTLRDGTAVVESSSPAGAFYARQTLGQITDEHGTQLPQCQITDSPRFSWRGVMLDCSRNYFSTEFLLHFLDLMALHKLNRFHWHLTDDQAWRLEIPGMPEVTGSGSHRLDLRIEGPPEPAFQGTYSAADVRRVVEHAASLHITVVPEIETPGHVRALLASHPELSCRGRPVDVAPTYGVHEDVLCAGNDEVFTYLGKVYDHVAALFPGPWVHAGGDECPKVRWTDCPRCQKRMADEGLADEEALQGWFMKRVAGMLADRGKTMVGWDEILEGGCSPDSVIMSWRGMEGGATAAKAGHGVVMAPQTEGCYLDHKAEDSPRSAGRLGIATLETGYAFDPVPPNLTNAERTRILGAQANLWTEAVYWGDHVEFMAFPRLCALAETFWTPVERKDLGGFRQRLAVHRSRLDARDVAYNPRGFGVS